MEYPKLNETTGIPEEPVQGGATGAATGAMIALMYMPLMTLFRAHNDLQKKLNQKPWFIIAKIFFFCAFFAQLIFTQKTGYDNLA